MAKSSIEKTNVMRLLDQKKVPYTPHTYPHGDDAVDGVTVAQMTGMDPAKVFKTLVARGASKTPYVFVIPVACELDLKKAAKAVGEKSIAMLHVSELTPLTGYVRGGCSPVGMKKFELQMIAFSVSEYFDELSISSTCCRVWRLISMKFSTAFCSLIVGESRSIQRMSS